MLVYITYDFHIDWLEHLASSIDYIYICIWSIWLISIISWLIYDYLLVVWLPSMLFPIYWVANHPNWLPYFSEGWPNHQPEFIWYIWEFTITISMIIGELCQTFLENSQHLPTPAPRCSEFQPVSQACPSIFLMAQLDQSSPWHLDGGIHHLDDFGWFWMKLSGLCN